MSEERCENCRFWKPIAVKDQKTPLGLVSYCRRYPPVVTAMEIPKEDGGDRWPASFDQPVTGINEWCGEWQADET